MKLFSIIFTFLVLFNSCKKDTAVFSLITPKQSGITFINDIQEYDSFNILNTEFIYNGAGVGIGDLNNDGLEDLFFAGNQVGNACYLNLGEIKFKDITLQSHLQKPDSGMWSSGVNIIDLDADGKKDIYVTNTLIRNPHKRRNLFYHNEGNDSNGIPLFKEQAAEYGIDDTSYASHAQFFDYDRDGDLDLFIGTNYIDKPVPGQYQKDFNVVCDENCDRLYRNDWDSLTNTMRFKEVSAAAGLSFHGYSHSTLIHDFNEDGWPDMYVANDYQSDDLIYLNNSDGTFTNMAYKMFRHQSSSAMGSDIGDINNDGKPEVITAEMLPFTNLRKKTLIGPANYSSYIYTRQYGYQFQFTRNTLQLHQGMQNGFPVYGDISFLAGVHETEWSWAPLFADFDLDMYQDLYITNGFPKDVTDHDFGEYRAEVENLMSDMDLQYLIPVVKVSNFMYQNRQNLTFDDVTKSWGMEIKSFSNGAAYGDLDNDGDLDLVVHNIDDAPFIFKNNTLAPQVKGNKNYITITLKSDSKNPESIGADFTIYFDHGKQQTRQVISGRGYLSQSSYISSVGLDTFDLIDSIIVTWPEGKKEKFGQYDVNQRITLKKNTATFIDRFDAANPTFFNQISSSSIGLDYIHHEKDFIDFNIQKTLPHKMSQNGVPICIGDLNGDLLDDVLIGGSSKEYESIFIQQPNGKFKKSSQRLKSLSALEAEDAGMLLLDIENDHDLDIIVSGGSYENLMANKNAYSIRVYMNDGNGIFTEDTIAIDAGIKTCSSALKSADVDNDGDLDLFIAGNVLPGFYPKYDKSYLLLNESVGGRPAFNDVSTTWLPSETGLLNDALFTDFNNDERPDLILAPEWGSVSFLQNSGSKFERIKVNGINDKKGWWTSLKSGDFDNDGDMDYIAGNYGTNIYFKCTSSEPITMYAKDFDSNGSLDPFISCFWRDTFGKKQEYFFHGRDEMIKQLILIRRRFQKYAPFGLATVQDVFPGKELDSAIILKTNTFSSSYIENKGGNNFEINPLPNEAQFAPIYGIQTRDVNNDGWLDAVLNGNDYGMELIQGLADAMSGVVLINDQKGGFLPMSIEESGFYTRGENRTLSQLIMQDKTILFQMINLDSLALFTITNHGKVATLEKNEYSGILDLPNLRKKRKVEFYPGDAFKSQSSNRIILPNQAQLTTYNSIVKSHRIIQ